MVGGAAGQYSPSASSGQEDLEGPATRTVSLCAVGCLIALK